MNIGATSLPSKNRDNNNSQTSKLDRLKKIPAKIVDIITRRTFLIELICAILIILFIYTGLNKMLDYNDFKTQMGRSPFIQGYNEVIALTLPTGELLISLLLIISRTRYLGLFLSFLLMAMFTGYIWLMLNYAPDLPCTCGGILSEMSWKDHLYFNAAITLLSALALILFQKERIKLKRI